MTFNELGAVAGALLKKRGERVAVAESSSGGLISAALLAVPGASAYFVAGGIIYTGRALKRLLGVTRQDMAASGLRSASEPYALFLATRMRERTGAEWALAESGAAGPTGNAYGDPAGHSALAVIGPGETTASKVLRTGGDDRVDNMRAFAEAALLLFIESLKAR